ncbi:MAG: hypothetical protein WC201_05555 [Bacilli bacterium]
MISAFLVTLCAVLSLQLFTITSRLNTINRLVIATPISLFESSIPLVNQGDEIHLYFDKSLLESNLDSYYQQNISSYVHNFALSFYYYNQDDNSYCVDEYCDAVEVQFTAQVIFNFNYSRTMFYEIKDMSNGS